MGRTDFEIVTALETHRTVLRTNLARIQKLIQTIDHLKGTAEMNSGAMFAGFSVPAGGDRFGEHIKLGGEPLDCKLSSQDTDGALCVFEFTSGWPRHRHRDQDEWIYVIEGEFAFEVGAEKFRLNAGESVFIPRQVPHIWGPVGSAPGKVINVYQPASRIEEFFRELSNLQDVPTREDVLNKTYTEDQVEALRRLFNAHGMDLLPPTVE